MLAITCSAAVGSISVHDRYVCVRLCVGDMPFICATGLAHQVVYDGVPMGLATNHTILPEVLKRAGYRTHAVGKWDVCV